jgi:hypothetical protein
VKEEALAFKMVGYIICAYWVSLKIFLGNSEIDVAAVLLRIQNPPGFMKNCGVRPLKPASGHSPMTIGRNDVRSTGVI